MHGTQPVASSEGCSPGLHGPQETPLLEYCPVVHAKHSVRSRFGSKPATHGMHGEPPGLIRLSPRSAQDRHSVRISLGSLPGTHSRHGAPSVEYTLSAISSQAKQPELSSYVSAGQGEATGMQSPMLVCPLSWWNHGGDPWRGTSWHAFKPGTRAHAVSSCADDPRPSVH